METIKTEREVRLEAVLNRLMTRIDDCQLGPVNSGRDVADKIAAECEAARELLAKQL